MKSKPKTYVLLVVVLGIWGIIGYKVFDGLNPKVDNLSSQELNIAFKPQTAITIDTFSVDESIRDPFLGTLHRKPLKKKSSPIKSKQQIQWMPIIYHGIIGKQNSKEKIYIISINGQQRFFKLGQEFNDIKLIRANTKGIVLSYKGERKTIVKQ